MRSRCFMLLLAVLFIVANHAWAAGVAVVPLFTGKRLHHVVTVSPAGADFTDPVAAAASITDASDTNRYVILVGPGKYELSEQLVLPNYVSLAGAGEYATILQGAISGSDVDTGALVVCGDKSTITGLLVYNTGGGEYVAGVLIDSGKDVVLSQMRILALGGSSAVYGMYNRSDDLIVRDVTSTAQGAPFVCGMYNWDASPQIMDTRLYGYMASNTRGMFNAGGSSPSVNNVTAIAGDAVSLSYGIYNYGSANTPTIMNSTIRGITGGIWGIYPGARILNNLIFGGVDVDDPGTQCRGNYDDALAAVGC